MEKTTLVIMAAGMGSRFGGLKQITPLGPNGEIILDFSIFDAKKAGFSKAVFIIKKEIEKDFREAAGKRIEKLIDVDYAFQELDKLPKGFTVPEGRTKPWGTGHAVLCAKDKIDTSFAVINADDFYGQSAYEKIHNHLKMGGGTCMVGYKLGNTLTENGTVSRGVCEVSGGKLLGVTEHTALDKNSGIPLDSTVSMNMWGFKKDIFGELESGFENFLKTSGTELKSEFFLPFVVDDMIKSGKTEVSVLETNERWYGVTYKEDAESVKAAVRQKIEDGLYNGL